MTQTSQRARVAAAGAVAVLSLGLAACGSSGSPSSASSGGAPKAASQAPSTKATVKIVNFTFTPHTVTVKVGGTVTWQQGDTTGHSVQSTSSPPVWKTSTVLSKGQTFSHTFTKAGTYQYQCGVHNYMKGTVKVVG